MSSVMRLRGVTKGYNIGAPNAVSVLNGVDLDVVSGEVIGLIAPSGAGKSTFLQMGRGRRRRISGHWNC